MAKKKEKESTKVGDQSSSSSYKTEEIRKLKYQIRKLRKHAEFNQRLLMHTLTSRSIAKQRSTSRERKTTQASRRPSLELYPPSNRDRTIEVIDNRINRSFNLPRQQKRVQEECGKLSRKEQEWLASVESLKIENNQTALHAMNEYRTLLGHFQRKEYISPELQTILLRLEMRLSEIEKIVELTAIHQPEAATPPTPPRPLRTCPSTYMSQKENYSSQNGVVSQCLTPESRTAFIHYGGGVQFSGIYSQQVNGVLELDTLPNLKENKVRVYLPIADYRCFSLARINEVTLVFKKQTVDSAELRALLLQFLNIDRKNKHDYILTIQTDQNEIERTCMSSDCPIRVLRNYSLFGIKDPCFPRIYLRRVLQL